jgi:hypothetical protein
MDTDLDTDVDIDTDTPMDTDMDTDRDTDRAGWTWTWTPVRPNMQHFSIIGYRISLETLVQYQ